MRTAGSQPWRGVRLAALRFTVTLALSLVFVALPRAARAQGFGAGGMPQDPTEMPTMGGMPTTPGGPSGNEPETHAASGAESGAKLPTQAAQLPENPNAIPPELRNVLGTDYDLKSFEAGRQRETRRDFYGVYYSEESGDYRYRVAFPFWVERTQPNDRASLFGLSYYNRRSRDVDADVFFPLFWKLRYGDEHTTIVGPFRHSESPRGHDNWLAPLFFEGNHDDGSGYLHIPPLLTFTQHSARDGLSIVGPLFCKWKGGPSCDGRTADSIDLGLAPLYFYGRDETSEYEVIPPLLHVYRYDESSEHTLNVWGPVWTEKQGDAGVFNVLPVFWHSWDKGEAHTTLFPLFHYGHEGEANLLVTPLFVNANAKDGSHTFATYLYARHRGRTELDMVTPLFWHYRDPDIDLTRTVAFPFFYREQSPRSDNLLVFPFYGHFERTGISSSRWITPLFRHETSLTGWQTNIFPLFHMGRSNRSTHLVAAPLLWDFASPSSRQTVVFPFYWRFADRKETYQVAGNTFYYQEKVRGGHAWQFHFFPFFSYGESPQGHWWNVLYGLAGYTREGTMAKMRMGYIPITLSE